MTLEEMEEEYKNHEVPEEIMDKLIDPFIFVMNIDDVLDELHKDESRCSKKLVSNDIKRGVNHLARYFVDVPKDLLEKEHSYLSDEIKFIHDVMGYSSRIACYAEDENYLELAKLFDFMIMNYSETISSKESRLVGLEHARNGIEYIDFRAKDKSEVLRKFMDKELKTYENYKKLEITK